jgi:hypothetical protein
MFTFDFGEQFHRKGSQNHPRSKVLNLTAGCMTWRPKCGEYTPTQSDQRGDGHD